MSRRFNARCFNKVFHELHCALLLLKLGTLAARVRHVVQNTFGGRRIVIFSGGEAKGVDAVLDEVKQIADGGGFGSIMGRNAFQRPRAEALDLLASVMKIYRAAP